MSEPTYGAASGKTGLPPGSLIHIGNIHEAETRISVIDYNSENFREQVIHSVEEIQEYRNNSNVTWLIIEGLKNVEIVDRIGNIFGIHQLVLEDILNTHQRPKFEEYDDYLYIVLKCLSLRNEQFKIDYEQASILILNNFVILFKEKENDIFTPLQKRLKTSKGPFRSLGADYLAYSILDTIVDQNFIIIDSLDDAVTSLEDKLLASEIQQDALNTIQRLKREIVHIRRRVSPVRELLGEMLRSESELIDKKTHIYLRDVYDHSIRVIESIDSYRELLTGLLDIYMTRVSNKMNEIMKVLTIFASIFIPLTFLTGIYGMNFINMPELHWKWAYPVLWILFITIPIAFLIYFKRKKWL